MAGKSLIGTFSYPTKYAELIEAAEKLARQDGKSFSELVLMLIKAEVEKNGLGTHNPIAIEYASSHQEPLDKYLNEGFIKREQWREKLSQESDMCKLMSYEALGITISQASNARIQNLRRQPLNHH